jgi:hypothetical protein
MGASGTFLELHKFTLVKALKRKVPSSRKKCIKTQISGWGSGHTSHTT